MDLTLNINIRPLKALARSISRVKPVSIIIAFSILFSVSAIIYCFQHNYIVIYGDSESHLNIAKRVVSGLTPGMAQLGGVWLPLPHILMMPFMLSDYLWQTGLAGSIVSGICYVISCVYLYKTVYLVTKNQWAAFLAFFVFALNPNMLYMQSTPMTELTLLVFFITSTYYFILFIEDRSNMLALIASSIFAFMASLSRYDGWFLVLFEAMIIVLIHFTKSDLMSAFKERTLKRLFPKIQITQGRLILFATVAFFGIFLWMFWDYLILGDPLYFTNSQYSAKSQQHGYWLARGELPAYHNLPVAFLYYFITSMSTAGVLVFFIAVCGFIAYIFSKKENHNIYISMMMAIPFIFYVVTLYAGQSVIFIPNITPVSFEWRLFNVRYGLMMVPAVSFFIGYLFSRKSFIGKWIIVSLIIVQFALFGVGYSKVLSFADGTSGLSKLTHPDAEQWLHKHYDNGLVLLDDYVRTISLVRSGIPMQNIIYIGNKPYWEESLRAPEKYAKWIIIQNNDSVWVNIMENPGVRGRMYKYFEKVYTSPDILIFKKRG